MKKVAFYTLGCKLNFSETSTIARQFLDHGYSKVSFEEKADVYVINTCSVTDHADKKCRKVVKEALKHSPNAYVAIVGCYAQLKPEEIVKIPGVDIVLGAAEKFQLLDIESRFEKKSKAEIYHSSIDQASTYQSSWSTQDRTRTFLKVQDGCDYSCTFCTIPMARGSSRSDSIANIVQKAEQLAQMDTKEIVLTGVNIGDFGIQNGIKKERFGDLVQHLDQANTVHRIRISSIEPNLLTPEIIALVAKSERFLPHFHLPLQSGSDKILKLMKRRYLRQLYQDKVALIREMMPHAGIGVDVIVGFPGETAEDFLETYTFLNELDVSYLHVFTYSERANTPAANMPNSVLARTRDERSVQLRSLSEKKKRAFAEKHLKNKAYVLFENDVSAGKMQGFTPNYIRVETDYDPLWINEIVPIYLNKLLPNSSIQGVEAFDVANTRARAV